MKKAARHLGGCFREVLKSLMRSAAGRNVFYKPGTITGLVNPRIQDFNMVPKRVQCLYPN